MKLRSLWIFGIAVLLALAVAGCASQPQVNTSTPAPTPTSTTIPTETPDIPATIAAGIAVGLAATEAAHQFPAATPMPAPTALLVLAPTTLPAAEPTPTDSPSPTPPPTSTPMPTATPTPNPTATPLPTPTPTPTPTVTPPPTSTPMPTATATPRPTATPKPTPTPPHSAKTLRDLMLGMINQEREAAGSPAVTLGNNGAAQVHADQLLKNCLTGHWGLDGTTAGMRYALAGGQQTNGENVSGINYCIQPWDNFARIVNPAQPLRKSMTGLMGSPGHRATILNPQYRKVNLGIAWNHYNMVVVQQFEGDYVRFEQVPHLEGDLLILEGRTVNGATPKGDQDKFKIDIYFHRLSSLASSQIAQTYCLDPGEYGATVIEPAPPGYSYNQMQAVMQGFHRCVSPYDAPFALVPLSYEWARELHEEVKATAQWTSWAAIQWFIADEWDVSASTFRVAVNINEVLESKGPGVYRVLLWGSVDGETSLIAEYPVFHQVEPPTTYK